MTTITHALIFTPGRRLSDSLQVLLKSNNSLTVIELTDHLDTALQILADNPPTLVLMDAAMPDGAAWQALEYIQQHCPQHRCLVLAQTSSESEYARQMGANVIHAGSVTVQSIQEMIADTGAEGLLLRVSATHHSITKKEILP
jgi:DNA-binding NarL/FixJ family response regulator